MKLMIPRYKLGETVYYINSTYNNRREHVECDICNSTGKYEINGEIYTCPKCKGEMETIHEGYKYIVGGSGKIGKIDIEQYGKKYRSHESRVAYMLDSTGVGSGSVHPEYKVFPTYELAQAFCDTYVPENWYGNNEEYEKNYKYLEVDIDELQKENTNDE